MDVSPSFVAEHSTAAAWLLSICGAAAAALAAVVGRKLMQAFGQAFQTLNEIKNNHLQHIESATAETRDAALQTNAKLDVLIGVIEKKL
jgi:hypothetical protein